MLSKCRNEVQLLVDTFTYWCYKYVNKLIGFKSLIVSVSSLHWLPLLRLFKIGEVLGRKFWQRNAEIILSDLCILRPDFCKNFNRFLLPVLRLIIIRNSWVSSLSTKIIVLYTFLWMMTLFRGLTCYKMSDSNKETG